LDIGAHIGRYALEIAKAVGEKGLVIAIEPQPENYACLVKNIRLNKFENITALNVAGWDKDCKMELFSTGGSSPSLKWNHGLGGFMVEARVLDNLVKGIKVDWIKIDVEGAEYEVLRGLENTLRKCQPKVILETFNVNREKVEKFMTRLGYSLMPIYHKFELKGLTYLYCCPLGFLC
jgi:FkbM family methyltransferase